MGMKKYPAAPMAILALGLFFGPTVSLTIDAMINPVAPLVSPAIANLSFMSPAMGQAAELTKKQSEALSAYNKAVGDFEVDSGRAARADQCEATAAELAGTGTLRCTHQHDERIQRPHRRRSRQNRSTQ